MASGLKSNFLILHRYPFSESSFIVKALSPDYGLVSFLVKGARRKESPFRVALDPLALVEIDYLVSPRRELQIPRATSLIRYHSHMRNQLESLAMAQGMAEVSLRLSQPGNHFREEYFLLQEAFAILDGDSPQAGSPFENVPHPFFFAHWLWKVADAFGFGMSLDECLECHQPFSKAPADLWPALGGGVCATCLGTRHPSWNNEFLQQIYVYTNFQRFEAPASRLEHFLIQYLRIHVGHALEIRSLHWLDSLRDNFPKGEPHVEQK